MNARRVVILGGGMAGLATAWELSSERHRDRIESITVYQRGWRLGGKGASSRGRNDRIEEHGLHVLLGYYDATFRIIREVYGELDRATSDPDCPIADWREAFTPTGLVGLADRHDGGWDPFVTNFSGNDLTPGEPGAEDEPLRPIDVAVRSLRLLVDFQRSLSAPSGARIHLSGSPTPAGGRADMSALIRGAGVTALATLLAALDRVSHLGGNAQLGSAAAQSLLDALKAWRDGLHEVVVSHSQTRRTWELIDLVLTNLTGMIADGLLSGADYSRIDHLDYRQWLSRNGAAEETLSSAIVRGMYDLTFAYRDGDRSRPSFSAGLGLQLASRMLFDFKGSIFWRMNAGMGEVIFAPLYEALRRRGVEFRFFHRLDAIRLGEHGAIGQIELTRQVDLAAGRERYEPLGRVDGLPAWPNAPDRSQLSEDPPDGLESSLESGPGVGAVVLRADADFDVVVLAVSLGAVPAVAGDLVAANGAWSGMVDNVATVATRSAQLWLTVAEGELGWQGPSGVTLSGFGETFDTWASMTHLLPVEGWGEDGPRSLAYFCSAMPDRQPGSEHDRVRDDLIAFLDREVSGLWPASGKVDGFDWGLLFDPAGGAGRERLLAQYWRANIDPSDRYVQSLPGSGKYRIAPGDTGFSNLVIAGDWTACGLDAGCLEAASRSGVLAARAVLGEKTAAKPEAAA